MGLHEYCKTEVHGWIVRLEEQLPCQQHAHFLVGVAQPIKELNRCSPQAAGAAARIPGGCRGGWRWR